MTSFPLILAKLGDTIVRPKREGNILLPIPHKGILLRGYVPHLIVAAVAETIEFTSKYLRILPFRFLATSFGKDQSVLNAMQNLNALKVSATRGASTVVAAVGGNFMASEFPVDRIAAAAHAGG